MAADNGEVSKLAVQLVSTKGMERVASSMRYRCVTGVSVVHVALEGLVVKLAK